MSYMINQIIEVGLVIKLYLFKNLYYTSISFSLGFGFLILLVVTANV
jgi:hypothetical protein